MGVTIQSVYVGDDQVTTTHEPSGATFTTDLPVDNGGKGRNFSPTDLVGTALASCILTIMAKAAERKDLPFTGTSIELTKEMVGPPRQIGILQGSVSFNKELSSKDKEYLLQFIKKCPVHQTLLGSDTLKIDIREKTK